MSEPHSIYYVLYGGVNMEFFTFRTLDAAKGHIRGIQRDQYFIAHIRPETIEKSSVTYTVDLIENTFPNDSKFREWLEKQTKIKGVEPLT